MVAEPADRAGLGAVSVLAFDTFGTVTDWYTGISYAVRTAVPGVDAGDFAREWRSRYAPILARVESGELGWHSFGELHRMTLADVADQFGVTIDDATADHLVRAWRTLPDWPDVVPGLRRLKRRFTVCALSNGNVGLLTEMARHNGFDWDFVGGADLWRHYKPAPELYRGIAELMEVPTSSVMMVATHQSDLDAARANGLRTAFVTRPAEWGGAPKDDSGSPANDVHATDLGDLADQLGA
ncbi:haloacid dehalogenase type II [Gordonia sinesedis]